MEKILQEFRIIETDDGYRIEIKGDKEALRDWIMHLDPRHMGQHGPEQGPEHGPGHGRIPFGPPWMWHGPRFRMRFGPATWAHGWGPWGWGEDDDDEDETRGKRKRHGRGRGQGRGHGHHEHGPHPAHGEAEDEIYEA